MIAGAQDVPELLDPFSRTALAQNGVDPNAFTWMIPLDSLDLLAGVTKECGVLAASRSGTLHVFRYTPRDGFQLANVNERVTVHVKSTESAVSLEFEFTGSSITRCIATLSEAFRAQCRGSWLDYVMDAIRVAMGVPPDAPVCLCSFRLTAPALNSFGTRTVQSCALGFITADNTGIQAIPTLLMPSDAAPITLAMIGRDLTARYTASDLPLTLTVSPGSTEPISTGVWQQMLSRGGVKGDVCPVIDPSSVGEFELFGVDCDGKSTVVLETCMEGIALHANPQTLYTHGTDFEGLVVLANDRGSMISLSVSAECLGELFRHVRKLDCLAASSLGGKWTIALRGHDALIVTAGVGDFVVGTSTIPHAAMGEIDVRHKSQGFSETDFKWNVDGMETSCTLVMPTESALAIWEEWDVRRTKAGVSRADIPTLYKQYNRTKKHNLLLVMFGDILLLNRAMNEGISLADLTQRLQQVGMEKFAEDEQLRNATVAKMLMLSSSLSAIKQKFELLASMAPYHWAQEEARWLSGVFGAAAVSKVAVVERKRLVPLIRRQIRTAQSDLLRTLAQVEAAARPLEAIFAADEIRNSWTSKVRVMLPGVVRGVIGASMLFTSGGVVPWMPIGAAFATSALGSVLTWFQHDREKAAQVGRAATVVLPWWDVLMRTLMVSIYEASEFVDDENARCMKRDRQLLDAAQDGKSECAARLKTRLRQRILDEHRNRFAEIVEGSGIRLAEVVGDIETAVGPAMRNCLDEFASTLVFTGRKRPLEEKMP